MFVWDIVLSLVSQHLITLWFKETSNQDVKWQNLTTLLKCNY